MPFDGARAQPKLGGDGLVVQAARHQSEHLELARREGLDGFEAMPVVGPPIGFEEGADLVHERRPGRLVGKQDVVRAIELDEASVRDATGDLDCIVERRGVIAERLEDERRRADARQLVGDIDRLPPSRLATAFSGEVVIRCRASNQRICSSLASGMKMRVKTRRKSGSSFAQPTRIMLRKVSSSASASSSNDTGRPQTVPYRISRVTRSGWRAA